VEGWYFAAFLWLCLLLALVIAMTYNFYKAKPIAAYLQAPYIVWLVFAGVLNLMIALMN
jgi:tryptophan-rich sensory protein